MKVSLPLQTLDTVVSDTHQLAVRHTAQGVDCTELGAEVFVPCVLLLWCAAVNSVSVKFKPKE